MKQTLTVGAALLATTSMAFAGGLDRSGQGVGAIFQDGNYAELSFGQVTPDVTGGFSVPTLAGEITYDSGNIGDPYTQTGVSLKYDINDQVSVALIFDQPFGANVNYSDGSATPEAVVAAVTALDPTVPDDYPIEGSNAEFRSSAITALGRYKIDDNWSVHGGLRLVTIDADAEVYFAGSPTPYIASYDAASATQVVVGGAYERSDIALRVALTYASEMEFSHETSVVGVPDGVASDTEYKLPQSVNLDFQSGIAEDTLLFGNIRWAEWSTTSINSFGYPANPLVSFENDSISYSLGVGRRINDQLSLSASIGFEAEQDGLASNLAPTDGNTSLTLGARYNVGNGMTVSGGYRMVWVGDAETELGDFNTEFADNTAQGLGITIGYTF